MLREFFAVTRTSVYHVMAGKPAAEKIAMKRESSVVIGDTLQNGTMIAICTLLISYIPEGKDPHVRGDESVFQREIEKVDPIYWGGHSSAIVALFKTKDGALACFKIENLRMCDSRFEDETLAVCKAIGDEHPDFYVCKFPGLCLSIFNDM